MLAWSVLIWGHLCHVFIHTCCSLISVVFLPLPLTPLRAPWTRAGNGCDANFQHRSLLVCFVLELFPAPKKTTVFFLRFSGLVSLCVKIADIKRFTVRATLLSPSVTFLACAAFSGSIAKLKSWFNHRTDELTRNTCNSTSVRILS